MKWIGPHVSIGGGVYHAPLNARALGATAFGLFTKNQRQWAARPFDAKTIDAFRAAMVECGYSPGQALAHDSYLINIGSPDSTMREKSLAALIDELTRCDQLGLPALNIHPGSHLGLVSEEQCCALIADSINRALDRTSNVSVVLENTSGQGTNIGYRFEHLASIIDKVEDRSRTGCCLDTCHAFAAGYDLRTKEAYSAMMSLFNRTIGLEYLRGLHLNDAKSALGSRVDRHQSIGLGEIGWEPFRFFMTDPRLDKRPMILETNDEKLWPEEIRRLSAMASGDDRVKK